MKADDWFGAPVVGRFTIGPGIQELFFLEPPRMPPGPCDCIRERSEVPGHGEGWVLTLCGLHRTDPTVNPAPCLTYVKRGAFSAQVDRFLEEL